MANKRKLPPLPDEYQPRLAQRPIEVIDVIEAFPELSWNLKNVLKYVLRKKDRGKDLQKAMNYLHREIHGIWLTEDSPTYSRDKHLSALRDGKVEGR